MAMKKRKENTKRKIPQKKRIKRAGEQAARPFCGIYFGVGLLFLVAALALCFYYYDVDILLFMAGLQNPLFDVIMFAFTASMTLYLGLLIFLIIAFWHRKDRELFYNMLAAVAIDVIVTLAVKTVIARPRPLSSVAFDAEYFSFPSGHTSRAFAIFGILNKHIKHLTFFFYGFAILVGLSRIYLGVHYPTDVLAGAISGYLVSWSVLRFGLGARLMHVVARCKARSEAQKKLAGKGVRGQPTNL